MRSGIKTTEFWIMLAAGLFLFIQQALWPDAPFPKEAFIALGSWIVARIGEKSLGAVDTNGKRAWETSEFWVGIVYSIAKYIYPAIPDDLFYLVMTWIFGRPAVKVLKDGKLSNLLAEKK